MYPTSAGYKSAIASYARETRITGKITLTDSTILAIYPWLVQQGSLYLNEQCVSQDGFEIGNVYAGELGIGLISTIGEFLNLVDNGDFVDSTGWGAEHGSLSVANNTCQLTANGSDDHSAVIQNVGAATITNHYYVRARVRVTNSSCSAIKAKVGGSEVTLVSTPVINQWYDASAVMIAIDTNQYVSLSHHYASGAIASGKVMEIQYVSEVDLTTAFGSPNEPDAAEVDEYIDRLPNYHWNGVVGWTDLATVGYAKRDFAGCVLEPVFEIYTTAWESVPLGVFNEIDISGNDQYTSFQALDNMILLDEPRGATDVTSVTPEQLITGACATAGVTLATSSATFNTFPNYNLLLTLPDNSPVETCRDIVMWACQANGTFARFNRAGELEIVPLHSASARSITKTERFSPTKVSDRLIKITQIDEKVLETIYSVGSAGQILYLDGNPFFESLSGSAITTALTNLLADLTQAEYTPYETQFIGDPSLQPGDYVTLVDTNVATDPVGLVTHTSWRYRGNHTLRSVGNAALVATIPSQNGKALTAISADLAHIVDLIVTGTITVGSGTTFESGYDPITKRTVFTATPTTPYRVGDLWLTSLSDFTGDMKKCVTQRLTGAYVAADWVVALGPIETAKLGTTVIEGGYIKTGLVDASRINTGTLFVGGPNQAGAISVRNASNQEIAKIDQYGINVNGTVGATGFTGNNGMADVAMEFIDAYAQMKLAGLYTDFYDPILFKAQHVRGSYATQGTAYWGTDASYLEIGNVVGGSSLESLKLMGMLTLAPAGAEHGVTILGNEVWHAGNDGAGSGLDADKLDTYEASDFLRLAGGGTITSRITLDGGATPFVLKAGPTADHVYMQFFADSDNQATRSAYFGFSTAGTATITLANEVSGGNIDLRTVGSGLLRINANVVWHEGNDGTGSGLDADLLDGYHALETATGNSIVKRNASGYIFGVFFNSTATDTAVAASHYWTEINSDGYLRPKTLANVRSEIVVEGAVRDAVSENITIPDDGFVTVQPVRSYGILFIHVLTGNGSTTVPSVLNYRCASTNPLMTAISKGSLVDLGTGTLTGTTGTDGRVTVRAHTDGKIYIENRTGAILYAGTAFLGK